MWGEKKTKLGFIYIPELNLEHASSNEQSACKRSLPVESVVGPLQCQLDKSVRMQFCLFDGCFPERREGVTHELQVLSLDIQDEKATVYGQVVTLVVVVAKTSLGFAHRLQVALLGETDVVPDFFIHCEQQLLRRRQRSHCL